MKLILCNSFSLNMLSLQAYRLAFVPIATPAAVNLVRNSMARGEFSVAIGHENTARLVASELCPGVPDCADDWAKVARTRPTVVFGPATTLLVAQYSGPRLPEGATSLPVGAVIRYWQVYVY